MRFRRMPSKGVMEVEAHHVMRFLPQPLYAQTINMSNLICVVLVTVCLVHYRDGAL